MNTVAAVLGTWRTLPLAGLAEIVGDGALVLAPHPDDESLGCGGLIAGACAAGLPIEVLALTDGAASHPGSQHFPPSRLAVLRAEEMRCATAALGLAPDRLHFAGLADGSAPHDGPVFDAASSTIASLLAARRLTTLLAPWAHDPHTDHLAAHRLAVAACRATGARHLSYPVWGWTLPPATPLPSGQGRGWRLDVAAWLPMKRRAIAAHASQHGRVIDDDPEGFVLAPGFLALFGGRYETYLEPARCARVTR